MDDKCKLDITEHVRLSLVLSWSGCPRTFSTSSELLIHNKEIHQSLQKAYSSLTLSLQREDLFAPYSFQSTNTKNTNNQICVISGCTVSLKTEFDLPVHYKEIHGIVLASSQVSSRQIADRDSCLSAVSHYTAPHEVLFSESRCDSSAPDSGQVF